MLSHRTVRRATRPKKRRRKRVSYLALTFTKAFPIMGKILAFFFGIFALLSLVLLLGFLWIKGLPPLISDAHLIFGRFSLGSERITLLPAIITTLMVLLLSVAIAIPIGVMSAIFLHEYAKPHHPLVRLLRLSIDILGGVPSIVYGLFGMIAFLPILGGTSSILAGSLTISMMLLPTVVRATEESLATVDNSLRAGSLALGAGKLRTVTRIVLPSAASGILSAVILSMGRVISESAPLLYTAGSVISTLPRSYLDSGATLAVALYQLSGEGWYLDEAYAAALILILLIIFFNALARKLSAKLLRHSPK
jgi:phosphate transport system permease protein